MAEIGSNFKLVTDSSELPNLEGAELLALDTETYDPKLMEMGPGNIRKDGFVVGISVATNDLSTWYIPVGHSIGTNVDRDQVARWLATEFNRGIPYTGANLQYDLGWLYADLAVDINSPCYDTQIAEPLIDEEQPSMSLQTLSKKYLGRGKQDDELIAAVMALGYKEKEAKGHMDKLTPEQVAKYAAYDVINAIEIFEHQRKELDAQDLWQIFHLESDLTPVIRDIRRRGVRVDLEYADFLNRDFLGAEEYILGEMKREMGFEVNPWAEDSLVRVYEKLRLPITKTPAGNPSFAADVLEKHRDIEFINDILMYRRMNKMRRDFIEGGVLKWHVNGRIHAEMHQLRSDDSGTRSGRFSYSNPNLQQQPSRDPFWGPLIRGLFLPDEGKMWGKYDYSQQEPRLTVHYAVKDNLPGAQEVADEYRRNPKTDYHQKVAEMAQIERRPAKDINLGLAYGMGKKKLAAQLGRTMEEAAPIFEAYHRAVPYVSMLSKRCETAASQRGYIKTLLGRRRHFNRWQPRDWKLRAKDNYRAYPIEEAREKWPNVPLVRGFTFKALNALIQGSAGDQTKKAMRDLYYDHGIVPQIQVHDELDVSTTDEDEARLIKHVMEHAVELEVPVLCEPELGPDWGHVKKLED